MNTSVSHTRSSNHGDRKRTSTRSDAGDASCARTKSRSERPWHRRRCYSTLDVGDCPLNTWLAAITYVLHSAEGGSVYSSTWHQPGGTCYLWFDRYVGDRPLR